MDDYGISLGKMFFVGLLSVVLMVDAVVGLQALYYWQLARAEAAVDYSTSMRKLDKLLEDQRKTLNEYQVLDAEKGIVAVPIKQAMKLTLEELIQGDKQKGGER